MPNSSTSSKLSKRLTGKELLAKLKDLNSMNKSAKAKACGYVKRAKSGKECAQLVEFMNALLDAQGIQLDGQSRDTRGRSLTYRASVQKNGSIIIGAGYTKEMGLTPGDRFAIKVGRKTLKLTAIDSEQSDEAEFEDFAHDNEDFDDDQID